LESKKISKTNAVTSQLNYEMAPGTIHIGPSDYVEWLQDRKWAYIRMEGTTFGNVPLNVEMKLEVWDSPNSAGVVIDAVRCCKLALDNHLSGAIIEPSAYFKKSPPIQYTDEEARRMTEEFITKYGWKHAQPRKVKAAAKKPAEVKPATRPSDTRKPAKSSRVVKTKK
jgi:myo-inositol-1-phosphate synthase